MKARISILALTLILAGCGVGRISAPPTLFDLGADKLAALSLPARAPIGLTFRAVPALSDTGVIWRIDGSTAVQAYASSRWVSAPYDLVRQRLTERLSGQGPVLSGQGPVLTEFARTLPQVQLTLLRFEQVFAPSGQTSEGRIVLQALLLQDGQVKGQLRIDEVAVAPTQDAAGGVQALRAATDAAADHLAQWLTKNL
jgi:cholesterol transport system auxiliary component